MTSEKKEFVLPANTVLQIGEPKQGILAESGGEFVLPDYMPKLQKVLRLEAKALPPTCYMSVSEAQMSGNVLHTLIYLGEDGEVGATVLPSKYEFSLPFDKKGGAPLITATVDVDSMTYRLNGPRKINIRTHLGVKPTVFSSSDISVQQKPNEIKGLHKLYSEMDTLATCIVRSSDIFVSDVISAGALNETRLLWCGSNASVGDIKVSDGGISVRGDVFVKVLAEEGESVRVISKRIPFEEFVECDVDRGGKAVAFANVISTEAAKESNGAVSVDIVIGIEAICDASKKIGIMCDAFSEEASGNIEYTDIVSEKIVLSENFMQSVGGSIAKIENIVSIIDTSGKVMIDETVFENGRVRISGKGMLNSIGTDGEGEICSVDYTVPIEIFIPCGEVSDAAILNNVSLIGARARTDGDNILVDMDISVGMRMTKRESKRVISSLDFSSAEQYQKNSHPICLIYPNGTSLWSLAKKYHVDPESLAKVNSLNISENDYDNPHAISSLRSMLLVLK